MFYKDCAEYLHYAEGRYERAFTAHERMIFQQAFAAGYTRAVVAGHPLIALTEAYPDPAQFERVLIYTQGVDFAGESFFDVAADALLPAHYPDPDDRPEIIAAATHWMPLPALGGAAVPE